MPHIIFYSLDRSPTLRDRRKLKSFLANLINREKHALESLSYIFCSDEHLLTINRDFLKHDYYTDVITFDLATGNKIEGEVYISIDRIKDNAKQIGVTYQEELHRVIFHAALHLCGYKDKAKVDQVRMRSAENKYLKLYFN